MKTKIFINLSIIALIITGCGSDDPAAENPTTVAYSQDTPKESLKTFFESFADGDREKFRAVTTGADSVVNIMGNMVDFAAEMKAFEKAAIDEYGENAWQEINQSGVANSMAPDAEFKKMLENVDAAEITIDGDNASCTVPDEDPFNLIKKDGKWFIDLDQLFGTETDTQELSGMSELMPQMVNAVTEVRQTIGQPNVTPQTLNEEMSKRMMTIIMSGMQNMTMPPPPGEKVIR